MAKGKGGLGRGLNALIADATLESGSNLTSNENLKPYLDILVMMLKSELI